MSTVADSKADSKTQTDSINKISETLILIQSKLQNIQEEFGTIEDDFTKFSVEETNSNNYVKSLMADLSLIKTELSNINDTSDFTIIINDLEKDIKKLYGLELDQIHLIPSVKTNIDAFNRALSTDNNILRQRIRTFDTVSKEQVQVPVVDESKGGTPKKSKRKSKRRKSNNKKYGGRKTNKRKSKRRKTKKRDQIGDELYMAALVAAAVNIGDSSDTTSEVDI
jgi:hypothetical protein